MSDQSYADYVEECYRGEILGEAFFGALADARADAAEAEKLRALANLEREVKELLKPAVAEAGRPMEPNAEQVEQTRQVGLQMGAQTWTEFLEGMRPELVKFVDTFRRSEGLAPEGKTELLRQVTRHEEALLSFVDAELSGAEGNNSLASIEAFLQQIR